LIIGVLATSPAAATEVFRWVDENGVIHFSQSAPQGNDEKVEVMTLDDSRPPGYDPEEDLYGVEAMAEEMSLLREEMAEKRDLARERQQNSAQQPVVQYQQPVQYGYPYFGYPAFPGTRPPVRPKPPRPQPPRPEPYPTDVLRPLDQRR